MPTGCGKFEQIDVFFDVLRNCAIGNLYRLQWFLAAQLFFPCTNKIETGEFGIQTEGQRRRRRRTDGIGHNPEPVWISSDIVEQ
jgi:hypothetical protein